ncbi:BspA family leucine-rich repeat surface protein [Vibrio cyclitrophicus]
MKKTIIALSLFASIAQAEQYVAIIDAKFTIQESTEPSQCAGNELTRAELDVLIANGDDVTGACVSQIEDFSMLLTGYPSFNQDISGWDMSSAKTLSNFMTQPLSQDSAFDQDISGWDVSNVENFDGFLITNNDYSHDLSQWEVSNATSWNDFYDFIFFIEPAHIPDKFM